MQRLWNMDWLCTIASARIVQKFVYSHIMYFCYRGDFTEYKTIKLDRIIKLLNSSTSFSLFLRLSNIYKIKNKWCIIVIVNQYAQCFMSIDLRYHKKSAMHNYQTQWEHETLANMYSLYFDRDTNIKKQHQKRNKTYVFLTSDMFLTSKEDTIMANRKCTKKGLKGGNT